MGCIRTRVACTIAAAGASVAAGLADVPAVAGVSSAACPPAGTIAYVGPTGIAGGQETIAPVNTAASKAGPRIRAGRRPGPFAVTPNGKMAYVVNVRSGTVTPVNLCTAVRAARVRLPGRRIPPAGRTGFRVCWRPEGAGLIMEPVAVTAGVTGPGAGRRMFGSKDRDQNAKVRERLERGGGQRAWAVVLSCQSRYRTGNFAVVPQDQVDHVTLTLRVEPADSAQFQATVRAALASHRPRTGGSIGVIFDPGDHSKVAVYPEWSYAPESAGRPRTQEMITAFLYRQAPGAGGQHPASPAPPGTY